MKDADKHIPTQTEGRQTDFTEAVTAESVVAAHQIFQSAKAKLLDVPNWHKYSGPASATFGLTDEKGILLHRLAQVGDYICIDLPATPGSDAGDGYEWVIIESIIEEGSEHTLQEAITLIVRPVPDPRKDSNEVAHFYSDASTSIFIVARYNEKVSAEVHGRNERPNNSGVDLHDAIRNTAIALSARVGLSGFQWKNMTVGLLR